MITTIYEKGKFVFYFLEPREHQNAEHKTIVDYLRAEKKYWQSKGYRIVPCNMDPDAIISGEYLISKIPEEFKKEIFGEENKDV